MITNDQYDTTTFITMHHLQQMPNKWKHIEQQMYHHVQTKHSNNNNNNNTNQRLEK